MSREELQNKLLQDIQDNFSEKITFSGIDIDIPVVIVAKEHYVELISWLKTSEWEFNHFIDITSVDYMTREEKMGGRYMVVVHLRSHKNNFKVRIKTAIEGEKPRIATLTELYAGASWSEREIFDLMGIRFTGHPRMTRLLNPDDFEGHPLRKDFPVKGQHRGRFPSGSVISNKRREPVVTGKTRPGPLDQLMPRTPFEVKETPLRKEGNDA